MSDIEATGLEGTEPVSTVGAETGTEVAVQETEPVGLSGDTPTEPSRLSVDEYGDHLVPITVNGKEQWIPYKEAQSGFMRQADYTRKTQEVAQLRQRLAQAEAIANSLESDPEGTLRALAEAFGVRADEDSLEFSDPDPVDQRLRAIEAREQQRQAEAVRAQIDQEIDTLVNTYGDFDLQSVTTHAVQNGMTLTAAYRDLNFDSVAAKKAEAAQIEQAKREAAIVEGGAHRTGVVEQQKPAGSIRDAWRQAQKSLGLS